MKLKIPRKYMTTWAVFFFLLSIILIVFAITRAVQTPKAKGALSYEQLIAKVKTTPSFWWEFRMPGFNVGGQ